MDGMHDLGGLQGFGSIEHTPAERPFHDPWEGRVHGMMLALGVGGRLPGRFRPAIEAMPPVEYLTVSYYERWLHALEELLRSSGDLPVEGLRAWQDRLARGEAVPVRHDPSLAALCRLALGPFPVAERAAPPPRFAVGERVRVFRTSPAVHSRCPRYVRGATGSVARVLPAEPLPELAVQGVERVEHTYSVAFGSVELWGEGAEPATVVVDLWETHLEAAS